MVKLNEIKLDFSNSFLKKGWGGEHNSVLKEAEINFSLVTKAFKKKDVQKKISNSPKVE